MKQGRIRLPSGFSASCSYRLVSESEGLLALPSAIFLPLRESEYATLISSDSSESPIHVTFGRTVGEASFKFVS